MSKIEVYIWNPGFEWEKFCSALTDDSDNEPDDLLKQLGIEPGHASMLVTTDDALHELYLSFWAQLSVAYESGTTDAPNHFVASLDEDVERCSRDPDQVFSIDGLDDRSYWAVNRYLETVVDLPYHLLQQNCCTVVYKALEAAYGGGAYIRYKDEVDSSGWGAFFASLAGAAAKRGLDSLVVHCIDEQLERVNAAVREDRWIWLHDSVLDLAHGLSLLGNPDARVESINGLQTRALAN